MVASMQAITRIDAIETRAATLNVSLWELCRRTGWAYSTLRRWRKGEASPTERTVSQRLGALERELDGIETKLREAVSDPPTSSVGAPRRVA